MNQVVIAGQSVAKIEYKGQPVVTFRMIDELHQRPESTARQTFNRNKERFIKDEDYFEVPFEEWSQIPAVCQIYGGQDTGQRNPIIFFSQSGYLMIVKPFNDDLSWQIQRELVKCYFIRKEQHRKKNFPPSLVPLAKELGSAKEMAFSIGLTGREAILKANQIVKETTGYDCMEIMNVREQDVADIQSDIQKNIQPADRKKIRLGKWSIVLQNGYYKAVRNFGAKPDGKRDIQQIYIGKVYKEKTVREKIAAKGFLID
jgi:hypothetical protein